LIEKDPTKGEVFLKAVLNLAGDFRSRHLLSAGVSGSLLGASGACGVSPDRYSRRSQVPSAPITNVKKSTIPCNTALLKKLFL
ncbi:MAG: hypothetical protein Q8935_16705, partial [Bacillota bacterium]|nr:hypothetical protein [Bacillota bacterium]